MTSEPFDFSDPLWITHAGYRHLPKDANADPLPGGWVVLACDQAATYNPDTTPAKYACQECLERKLQHHWATSHTVLDGYLPSEEQRP
jgi:hypothetical protein